MTSLYRDISERLAGGETFVLATVVHTRGSTPREVGARMIVTRDGGTTGTVGGGCGEAEVWSAAMDVLETGEARTLEVDLLHDQDAEGGRACGGIMHVFVERVSSSVSIDQRAEPV